MNRDIIKEIKTSKEGTFLVVRLYYTKGGMDYFTGSVERRGYYLSVVPEEIGDGFRKFGMFTGIKRLLLEVPRKSAKGEAEARRLLALGTVEQELVNYVAVKAGLQIV